MSSFAEFESALLSALQQERSELQGLHGESEAQLSAWVEHLFRDYLGYTHFKEITREGSAPVGSKGSKQLFPDLRINVFDNGLIFVECKRVGRLDGPKGQQELSDAESQLKSYIRAHVDQAAIKPKTVLGIVTDGNRWFLIGLNKANDFHTIAEWAFLTDDPRLIAQRLWLLAKPALAQPTSALVEFLARRTLADLLKENTRWLTKKVNEQLADGSVSEELLGKWLRDALSDPAVPPSLVPGPSPVPVAPGPEHHPAPTGQVTIVHPPIKPPDGKPPERHRLRLKFWQGLLSRPKAQATRHANIAPGKFSWIAAGSGVRGVPFVYAVKQEEGRVELFIDRGPGKTQENKSIFNWLEERKEEIERAFGGKLSWERLEGKQGCRIAHCITVGGYRSDESKWPEIQDAMIDAMIRLENALTPHLAKLKTELASEGA
jgi:hypothetical protein